MDENQKFEHFKLEVKKYIDQFSLGDWEISFSLDDLTEEDATMEPDLNARSAKFTFPRKNETDNHLEIRRTAFHEVCELLLSEMYNYLDKQYNSDFTQELGHRIIRRLENAEFGYEGIREDFHELFKRDS